MNAALIQFHRLAVEHLVLGGQIEIFMAPSARLRQMQRVDAGSVVPGRKNIVPAVTIRTAGHVDAFGHFVPPMPLVDLSLGGMTVRRT